MTLVIFSSVESWTISAGSRVDRWTKTGQDRTRPGPVILCLSEPWVPWQPQIKEDQLTLSQPGGRLCPPNYNWPPGFSGLPTALHRDVDGTQGTRDLRKCSTIKSAIPKTSYLVTRCQHHYRRAPPPVCAAARRRRRVRLWVRRKISIVLPI